MPQYPNFYGPLDWYDPSYRPNATIGSSPKQGILEKLWEAIKEQPTVRTVGAVMGMPEEGVNKLGDIVGPTINEANKRFSPLPDISDNVNYHGISSSQLNEPKNWKIAMAVSGPGKGRIGAKIAERVKALNLQKAADADVANAIRLSKGYSEPLDPKLGIVPKSAQLRQQDTFGALPNRSTVTEGSTKTVLDALTPDSIKRPPARPIPYEQKVEWGMARGINKPRQLGTGPRYYVDPEGVARPTLGDITPEPGLSTSGVEINRKPRFSTSDFKLVEPDWKSSSVTLPRLARKPMAGELPSIEKTLRRDSSFGEDVADKVRGQRIEKGVVGGNWESKYDAYAKQISKEQWPEFQAALESGQPLADPRLEAFRQQHIALDKGELVKAAKDVELKVKNTKGEMQPFVERSNYWPHIYPEGFWNDTSNISKQLQLKYKMPEELANKIAKHAKDTGGHLVLEPEMIGKAMAARYGQQLKGFQKVRQELSIPGYRTDPEVYKVHIRDMADRVTAKKHFGDMDIAGGEFADLIRHTDNPNENMKLLTRVFDREAPGNKPGKKQVKVTNAAMTLAAGKNLSMFMLNNLQQNALLAAKGSARGIAKGIASIPQRTMRLRKGLESGALQPIHSNDLSGVEGLQNKASNAINTLHGMSRGETFNRSLSAVVGQESVVDWFKQLKRKPNNAKLRTRLEQYTHTKADDLLLQDSLTKKQMDTAGGVMSEGTQGRAQAFDLPYHATGGDLSGVKNLALQFKKYPYVQTKLALDAFKDKPIQTALTGTGAYLAAGEGVGAIKDAKRAAVDKLVTGKSFGKAWKEQRDKRGPIGIGRAVKDLTEGWAYGLPVDLANSIISRGVGKTIGSQQPVTIGMAGDAGDAIRNFMTNKDKKKGSKALTDYALEWAPFVGRDIVAARKKKASSSEFKLVEPKW